MVIAVVTSLNPLLTYTFFPTHRTHTERERNNKSLRETDRGGERGGDRGREREEREEAIIINSSLAVPTPLSHHLLLSLVTRYVCMYVWCVV